MPFSESSSFRPRFCAFFLCIFKCLERWSERMKLFDWGEEWLSRVLRILFQNFDTLIDIVKLFELIIEWKPLESNGVQWTSSYTLTVYYIRRTESAFRPYASAYASEVRRTWWIVCRRTSTRKRMVVHLEKWDEDRYLVCSTFRMWNSQKELFWSFLLFFLFKPTDLCAILNVLANATSCRRPCHSLACDRCAASFCRLRFGCRRPCSSDRCKQRVASCAPVRQSRWCL